MSEPLASRVRRRVVTVPTVVGATAAAAVGFPVVAPALVVADLARGRRRLPALRVYLFALQYLVNDTAEIVLAPLLWVRAGFGTRLGSPGSLARHRRLQWWSLSLLARRAERLLGLVVDLDRAAAAALRPGPVVVIGRHASPFDASLPALVYGREGFAVRGVIMAEMLADPGFDLLYGRLGSVFISRDDGARARAAIGAMAASARNVDGDDVAIGIFPEGRLFRPAVRDRSLARLADTDPVRAERLAGLRHVLPPRPGGLRILLEAWPEADVVVVDHEGLDDVGGLRQLVSSAPLDRPVRVTARRIARAGIPGLAGPGGGREGVSDPDAFAAWLDGLWLELDADRVDRQGRVGVGGG
jgi:1-acyl-sn-glycerol-3-phosphate acyltransferase